MHYAAILSYAYIHRCIYRSCVELTQCSSGSFSYHSCGAPINPLSLSTGSFFIHYTHPSFMRRTHSPFMSQPCMMQLGVSLLFSSPWHVSSFRPSSQSCPLCMIRTSARADVQHNAHCRLTQLLFGSVLDSLNVYSCQSIFHRDFSLYEFELFFLFEKGQVHVCTSIDWMATAGLRRINRPSSRRSDKCRPYDDRHMLTPRATLAKNTHTPSHAGEKYNSPFLSNLLILAPYLIFFWGGPPWSNPRLTMDLAPTIQDPSLLCLSIS